MDKNIGFNTIPRDRELINIIPKPFKVKEMEAVFEIQIHAKSIDSSEIIASKALREKIVGSVTTYGLVLSIDEILSIDRPKFQPTKCNDTNYKANVKAIVRVVDIFEGVLLTDCENPEIAGEQATYTYGENKSIIVSVPFAEHPDTRQITQESKKINLLVESVTANCGDTKIYVVAQPFIFDDFPYEYRITGLTKSAMVLDDKETSTISGKKITLKSAPELLLIDQANIFTIEYAETPRFTFGDVAVEIKNVFRITEKFTILENVEDSQMFVPIFEAMSEERNVLVFLTRELDTVPMSHILYLLALYYSECFIYIPYCIDPLCGFRYVVCKGYRGRGDVPKQIYEATRDIEKKHPTIFLGGLFTEGIPENDVRVLVYHNRVFESVQGLEKVLPQAGTKEYDIRIKRNQELWKKNYK